jgi:hypothetical protein
MFCEPHFSFNLNVYAYVSRISLSGTALASLVSADNTGPPYTALAVKAVFRKVRSIFPNAERVFSSTWDSFVAGKTNPKVAQVG